MSYQTDWKKEIATRAISSSLILIQKQVTYWQNYYLSDKQGNKGNDFNSSGSLPLGKSLPFFKKLLFF